jgi:hypothetical protein
MLQEAPVPFGLAQGPTEQDISTGVAQTQSLPLAGALEGGKPLPYIPLWDLVVLPKPASSSEFVTENPTNQVVIVGGTPEEQSEIAHAYSHVHAFKIPTSTSIEELAQYLATVGIVPCADPGLVPHFFWLAPHNPQLELTQESILAEQQQGVLACFRLIKALLQFRYANKALRWTVITRQTRALHASETVYPTHASLLGLFGSLAKEYPRWKIQLVDLPTDAPLPLMEMLRLPADSQGHGWLYRHRHWYRQILVP